MNDLYWLVLWGFVVVIWSLGKSESTIRAIKAEMNDQRVDAYFAKDDGFDDYTSLWWGHDRGNWK